jgi:hypothetical protein
MTARAVLSRPQQISSMAHARRKTMQPIKPLVAAFALAAFASAAMPAAAQDYATQDHATQDHPVECAQRDVQLVTQLEQIGEAQSLPGEIMFEAFMTLLRARAACSQGRVAAGLALYDSVFKASLAGEMLVR